MTCLIELGEYRLPTMSQIAKHLDTDVMTIKRELQRMETLVRIDSSGVGKAATLHLTNQGKAMTSKSILGLPVLGEIAAGPFSLAEQQPIGFLPRITKPDRFGLVVAGSSMEKLLFRGDVAVLQAKLRPQNGQICAVRIQDDLSTLKRFYQTGNSVQLLAENPRFKTIKCKLSDVHIDGVYESHLPAKLVKYWLTGGSPM